MSGEETDDSGSSRRIFWTNERTDNKYAIVRFGVSTWGAGTAFVEFDVTELASGVRYVCILAHTNHTPPNATYWAVLPTRFGKNLLPGLVLRFPQTAGHAPVSYKAWLLDESNQGLFGVDDGTIDVMAIRGDDHEGREVWHVGAPRPLPNGSLGTKGVFLVWAGNKWQILSGGSNGQVLTYDSTQTLGVKWA